jgi:hypothetical protein
VIRPENIEQLIIADLRGIEFELENLCVPSLVRANVLVAWVFLYSTGVTDRCIGDSFQVPECFFHAPKTAGAKCRFLSHVRTIKRERLMRKARRCYITIPPSTQITWPVM